MDEFSTSEVHSVEEMIKYNEEHADVCLPPGMLTASHEKVQ